MDLRRQLERLIAAAVSDFCFLIEWGMARSWALGALVVGALTLEVVLTLILLALLGASP